MYLYNSATHKKAEFTTHTPGHVEMYTCGPTVYHFAHIGNLRSYIMEDVLEKYLRFAGYDVNRVMNITDVGHLTSDADEGEDKMFKGTVEPEFRSLMNIPFVTESAELDKEVVAATKAAGYDNLKGHKSVGGLRASIYNAMPKDGVEALVKFLKDFEANYNK